MAAEVPEYPLIVEWLKKFNLADSGMTKEQLERRYMALALTSYGDDVKEDQKGLFLEKIKHMEHRIAAT